MKIAVLGGTGHIGIGLSLRLAIAGYEVIVGSRKGEKARQKAEEYTSMLESRGLNGVISGADNAKASELSDVAILAIPYSHVYKAAESLKEDLAGKIVITPVVPMEKKSRLFIYAPPPEGSAAEKIASILKDSRVVSAFQTVPAERFANLDERFEWDVPVCSDDDEAKRIVLEIVNSIDGLRGLDAGPLAASRLVEGLTPLLINISIRNKVKDLSVKFV
ncbi:NADPH-dependent F420 reductase [Archaeoglobus veneficus]|uniref:NADPH-dependent F420 reductase n=1 Tax=Archaeoglobus veneficus (strain DSM 11195 / SNP6) TaxID=693661 RepID=F2KNB4_ARCVS|nr:NADPH-dependent F420 reductase [Archaeoglobus veneficus]AEA47316.1 NADPH-dependent F420 reductase [Archaeoglobus veneficus SNP6]